MVYVFLAEGFEEIEALTPVDLLRRAGFSVKTVGVGGRQVAGAHGISVLADLLPEEMQMADCELIVLPGGLPGTTNLEASKAVQEAISAMVKKGGLIGAICAAPSILGHLGLLNGRKATCYPGYEQTLSGAQTAQKAVVTDGNFITANGAGAALLFSFALINALGGDAEAIKAAIQWRE